MADLIDRQAAIDAVNRLSLGETDATRLAMRIGDYLERLPSAQPTQLNTHNALEALDCISRQAAIDTVRSYYDECDEREESIEERIERLPSADIDLSGFSDKLWKTAYERGKADAVRHGHWIDKDGGIATCSECGERWGVWSVMNYCPHCGALMDEVAQ